jgi:hypothetical protein
MDHVNEDINEMYAASLKSLEDEISYSSRADYVGKINAPSVKSG